MPTEKAAEVLAQAINLLKAGRGNNPINETQRHQASKAVSILRHPAQKPEPALLEKVDAVQQKLNEGNYTVQELLADLEALKS